MSACVQWIVLDILVTDGDLCWRGGITLSCGPTGVQRVSSSAASPDRGYGCACCATLGRFAIDFWPFLFEPFGWIVGRLAAEGSATLLLVFRRVEMIKLLMCCYALRWRRNDIGFIIAYRSTHNACSCFLSCPAWLTSSARMWKLLAMWARTLYTGGILCVCGNVMLFAVVCVGAPGCVSAVLRMITFHSCHWPTSGALDNKSFNVLLAHFWSF